MWSSCERNRLVSSSLRVLRVSACAEALVGLAVIAASVGYTAAHSTARSHNIALLLGNGTLSASFMAVGLLLALRRPRLPIGWLLLLAGLFWSSGCLVVWPHHLVASGQRVPAAAAILASADSQWAWPLAVVPAVQLTLLLLPDGRLRSPRLRPVARVAVVAMLITTVALALEPTTLAGYDGLQNYFGISGAENVVGPIVGLGAMTLLVVAIIGLVGLVREFRRSVGVRRQQMRWIAVGAAAAVAGIASSSFTTDGWVLLITTGCLSLVPVCVAIAVLRYRLYDLGRVISRTVSYAAVTAALVAIYAGIVTLVGLVTGGGPAGVAAGTLGAAAVFRPLRRRIQAGVDRRFNRASYDAASTVDAFAARLRTAVDIDTVIGDLAHVVDDAFEPSRLSLWMPSRA